MDYKSFLQYLSIAAEAHQEKTNKFGKKERVMQSGGIPYVMHPLWCSTMVYMEPLLPESIRIPSTLALLLHDILEDTTVKLPETLDKETNKLINAMTVEKEAQYNFSSWAKEKQTILDKPIHIQLLKLYDKTATLYDCVLPEKRFKEWTDVVEKLAENVEKAYGTLNIVILARSLVQHYRKTKLPQ